jgi:hypothetical protein
MNKLPIDLDDESMCRLIGGRVGATAAILAFLGCYIYGMVHYGFLVGVALGWLPAAVVAWLAAHATASAGTSLLRRAVLGSKHFSSLVHASRLHR